MLLRGFVKRLVGHFKSDLASVGSKYLRCFMGIFLVITMYVIVLSKTLFSSGLTNTYQKYLFIFTLASQSASQLLLRWSFFCFCFYFLFLFFFALSACFGGCMGSADAGPRHEWLSVSLPHSSWPSPEDWGCCFGVRLTPIPPSLLSFCFVPTSQTGLWE